MEDKTLREVGASARSCARPDHGAPAAHAGASRARARALARARGLTRRPPAKALVAKAHGLSDPDDVLALQVLELDRRESARASRRPSPDPAYSSARASRRPSLAPACPPPVRDLTASPQNRQRPPLRVIENLDVFVSIAPGADGAPRPTSALRQIYLRHNAIGDLESAADELQQHPALELLALSHNNISTIAGAGLSALRSLRVLDLSHNAIEHLDPADLPPALTMLDLRGNPCARESLARGSLVEHCVSLRELDGAAVTAQERRAALGDERFESWQRQHNQPVVLYVPLHGEEDKPSEPERCTRAIRFFAGDDLWVRSPFTRRSARETPSHQSSPCRVGARARRPSRATSARGTMSVGMTRPGLSSRRWRTRWRETSV